MEFSQFDHTAMCAALEEADRAAERGEVPIGAVLIDSCNQTILSRAGNETILRSDPTAHAEILVIRDYAAQIGKQRIPGTTLYVTLEPCTMCAAAIAFARIDRVVFAASDPKGGGILHGAKFFEQATCHHKKIHIQHGLMAEESTTRLKTFFKARR